MRLEEYVVEVLTEVFNRDDPRIARVKQDLLSKVEAISRDIEKKDREEEMRTQFDLEPPKAAGDTQKMNPVDLDYPPKQTPPTPPQGEPEEDARDGGEYAEMMGDKEFRKKIRKLIRVELSRYFGRRSK